MIKEFFTNKFRKVLLTINHAQVAIEELGSLRYVLVNNVKHDYLWMIGPFNFEGEARVWINQQEHVYKSWSENLYQIITPSEKKKMIANDIMLIKYDDKYPLFRMEVSNSWNLLYRGIVRARTITKAVQTIPPSLLRNAQLKIFHGDDLIFEETIND